MNSDRPDLPLTIARLVRGATPVTRLAAPSVRLARWVITSTALVTLSVVILGVRTDVAMQVVNGWFVARASATLVIAVGAAIVALFMSVPGFEPSLRARALPLSACLVWAAMLVAPIGADRSPLDLLLQVAPHPSCAFLIAATALPPAVMLVGMLRDAAPLQVRSTGALAGLASLALGALGTQFVCTNDAAAHHLLWHFSPVVLLTLASFSVGASVLGKSHQRPA